jgi:hypothetical protein
MIVHSSSNRSYFAQSAHIDRTSEEANPTSLVQSEGLVDVTGFEPATPCLQIQRANLDDVKKDEQE